MGLQSFPDPGVVFLVTVRVRLPHFSGRGTATLLLGQLRADAESASARVALLERFAASGWTVEWDENGADDYPDVCARRRWTDYAAAHGALFRLDARDVLVRFTREDLPQGRPEELTFEEFTLP